MMISPSPSRLSLQQGSLSPIRSNSPVPFSNQRNDSFPSASLSFYCRVLLLISLTVVVHTFLAWHLYDGVIIPPNAELHEASKQYLLKSTQSYIPELMINKIDANYPPFDANSRALVWDLAPPILSCPDIERVGQAGEGGKWICGMNQLIQEGHNCIVYSFGISTDVSFEWEILRRTSCTIYAFDPSIGQIPYENLAHILHVNESSFGSKLKDRFIFHKMALGSTSGSSGIHSLNEHLFDAMNRLGHTFINLLKVDVEGGEWDFFNTLYTNRTKSLPVGQLLIELHYTTMPQISTFFRAMQYWGLQPFSREINLLPSLAGNKPFASEYSFIHPSVYFQPKKRSSLLPKVVTKQWLQRPSALMYILTRKANFNRLCMSLSMIRKNLWQDYPYYPLLIFHDDLNKDDEYKAQHTCAGSMPLTFHKIQFQMPASIVRRNIIVPNRTICDPAHSTLGYRHMCRFHAYGIHETLQQLGYFNGKLEYIMRLDDDSYIDHPIGYDFFQFMKVNHKKYGFVSLVPDDRQCVMGLWENARQFLNRSVTTPEQKTMLDIWPDPLVVYNNFEISHVSVWQNELWLKYVQEVENLGAIYTLRWGDAPLHSVAIAMVLQRSEIHAFRDIAYRHLPFLDQKPKGLLMPGIDPFGSLFLRCQYYASWTCTELSLGLSRFQGIDAKGMSNNQPFTIAKFNMTRNNVSDIVDLNRIGILFDSELMKRYRNFALSPSAITANMHDGSGGSDGLIRGVMFTFGHSNKEDSLVLTLMNICSQYAIRTSTPIVVFYFSTSSFHVDVVESKVKSMVSTCMISFIPVPSDINLQSNDTSVVSTKSNTAAYCQPADLEVRTATRFFISRSINMLKALGFEWFFRFGDESRLLQPWKKGNLFQQLQKDGKRYAFMESLPGRPECVGSLWNVADRVCETLAHYGHSQHAAAATDSSKPMKCSPLYNEWSRGNVIVTSLEISHVSVWESAACSALLDIVDIALDPASSSDSTEATRWKRRKALSKANKRLFMSNHHRNISASTIASALDWGDSAVHTMCAVLSLMPNEIKRLQPEDFSYRVSWAKNLQSKIGDKRMQMDKYINSPQEKLNAVFNAQRLGWLGGDVATSLLIPPFDKEQRRVLWLFGDSLIGMSDETKRIKDHARMLQNTVAVTLLDTDNNKHCFTNATAAVKEVRNIKYYWGTAVDGQPKALFTLPPSTTAEICKPHQKLIIWPMDGITIVANSGDAKLIVVSILSCSVTEEHMDLDSTTPASDKKDDNNVFTFEDVLRPTALFLVHNPQDAPDLWRYDHLVLPGYNTQTIFRWMSVAADIKESHEYSRGYVKEDEMIIILAAYEADHEAKMRIGPLDYQQCYESLLRIPAKSLLSLSLEGLEALNDQLVWQPLHTHHSHHHNPQQQQHQQGNNKLPLTLTLSQPKRIFGTLVPEASLFRDVHTGQWLILFLHMAELNIQLCRSADNSLTGNWQCEYVADLAEWKAQTQLITYAAKSHPHFLQQGCSANSKDLQIVVSFVSNSLVGPSLLFEPQFKEAYTPKFVLLTEKTKQQQQEKKTEE